MSKTTKAQTTKATDVAEAIEGNTQTEPAAETAQAQVSPPLEQENVAHPEVYDPMSKTTKAQTTKATDVAEAIEGNTQTEPAAETAQAQVSPPLEQENVAQPPSEPADPLNPHGDPEYAMLRLFEPVKARGSAGKRIAGGGSVRIFLRPYPFPHFEVLPEGTQIPIFSVAAADPIKSEHARRMKAWRDGR
jgi:hypothetical protein